MSLKTAPRLAGVAAIVYVTLTFAALGLAPTVDIGATPGQAQAYAEQFSATDVIGGYLAVLAALALIGFGAYLAALLRTAGKEWLASIALAGVAIHAATLAVGKAALAPMASQPAPELAAVLLDVHTASIWAGVAALALPLIAAAALATSNEPLPRWIAVSGAMIGAALLITVPLAPTGAPHIAAVLLDLWLVATAIVFLRRTTAPAQVPTARVKAHA